LAQPRLSDIKKIELVSQFGGPMSGDYKQVELIKENNAWSDYRLRDFWVYDPKTYAHTIDSTRRFLKTIPDEVLSRLLTILAERDTAIHIDSFKINNDDLSLYIDSLNFMKQNDYPLTTAQRTQFVKLLHTDSIVKKVVYKLLHHKKWDDESGYSILITTFKNQFIWVNAHDFGYPYYLPWYYSNLKLYNPEITLIFEEILDDPNFAQMQKKNVLPVYRYRNLSEIFESEN